MIDRRILLGALGAAAPLLSAGSAAAQAVFVPADQEAFDPGTFPYPLRTVRGSDAMEAWLRSRADGAVTPVVIGTNFSANRILEAIKYGESPAAIIAAAAGLSHPRDLLAMRRREQDEFEATMAKPNPDAFICGRPVEAATPAQIAAYRKEFEAGPELGRWPSAATLKELVGGDGLTTVYDFLGDRHADAVHIALLPTRDWTEAPAYLGFGGFNSCPAPELQIAAMRSLRDRYGAELVACSFDTVEIKVARRPATRDEAIALARELHAYCNDTIDQGFDTVSNLAAFLMTASLWTFWWD